MTNLNYDVYFHDDEDKYYNSKMILSVLEDILEMDISDLKEYVNGLKVNVTREEIKDYLDKKFEKENKELKKKIESHRSNQDKDSSSDSYIQDLKEASQDFTDRLIAKKYQYESYTLKYFNKYTDIARNKVNKLLDIIEKIGNKDTESITDDLEDLDIVLDEDGNVLKSDIIRLIEPTIYNIAELTEKISCANNLDTYLTFKMSLDTIYRNDLSEEEVYPHESIQVKSLNDDYSKGNVNLSARQKAILEEQSRRSRKICVKALLD